MLFADDIIQHTLDKESCMWHAHMFSIKCQRMTDELLPRDKQAKHPSPAIMDQGPSDERQKDGDKSV